jgi:hypothetical protein
MVIVTTAAEDLELFQIDVANAYLNGVIDAQIYMCQPTGFEDKRYPNSVWELLKGLYGLKQAGNIWNAAIHSYILEIGFTRTSADLCVYTITFPGRDHMIIVRNKDRGGERQLLWYNRNVYLTKTAAFRCASFYKMKRHSPLIQ